MEQSNNAFQNRFMSFLEKAFVPPNNNKSKTGDKGDNDGGNDNDNKGQGI